MFRQSKESEGETGDVTRGVQLIYFRYTNSEKIEARAYSSRSRIK